MLNIGQLGPAAMNDHMLQKLGWQMANLPLETANAFANWYLSYASVHPQSIDKMRDLLEVCAGRVKDMSQIPRGSGPILVVGSGSSLNAVGPTLKDWKGAVMCSTSQASTLIKYGRAPDYVVCLDPREAPQDELAAPDFGNAVLLAHVSMPHAYMVKWIDRATGPIYLGRIMEPTYDWYTHHLGRGYPWIRHIIMPMIDSVAAEISWATWLGYGPIYLSGVDYGGPRFDRWDWSYQTESWSVDATTSKVDWAASPHGARQMSYASRGSLISAFMQIANFKYQQRIYNTSDRSTLVQFPHMQWQDVMADAIPPEFDRKKVIEDLEVALGVWDTFMVPINGGWGPDFHTYIADDAKPEQIATLPKPAVDLMLSYGALPTEANYFGVLHAYNFQIKKNLEDFQRIENEHKQPVQEMINKGMITVEAGDLLMHGTEEFKEWDWHKIQPIDIPYVLQRRRWLIQEASRRGYSRSTVYPLANVKEASPGDLLAPGIQQMVELNQSGDLQKAKEVYDKADIELKIQERTGKP